MIGIGFDSGGTHTTYAIENGDGVAWPDGNECGDSISNARGDRSTKKAISWITDVILRQPYDEMCVWIGAAGFSGPNATSFRELFEPMVHSVQASGKACDVLIANDAISILKAPPLYGCGVAAIVGTGSVVLGAHPDCPDGVVKRGGAEWLVSDEGSGVWMTLECIKRLLHDIQTLGSHDYHSPLLDRLCGYFGVDSDYIDDVPATHRALARAEMLARVVSEGRADQKRRLAGFVYPHLFDLAVLKPGHAHDRIAAQVLSASVSCIIDSVRDVSDILAAYTADSPNSREPQPVVVGGNIAANDSYSQLLISSASECSYVKSLKTVGDGAGMYAELAWHYLNARGAERRKIAAPFDPLHPVLKLI